MPVHCRLCLGALMNRFTTRPEILGTFGVVASTHWLATAAGMAVLERGGNAFDAAVATGFALQVVEPHLNGPGGEVPLIFAPAGGCEVKVLCGQGAAPSAATLTAYGELGLDMVPGTGLLAAVVPGAFDAWMLMLRDYGSLPLREVLQYAIGFARDGCPLVPAVSETIDSVRSLFEDEWASSAEIFLPGGEVPAAGSIFRNVALAQTYERLLREAEAASGDRCGQIEAARKAWYSGFVAEAIDEYFRSSEVMDTTGRRNRGLLSGEDMASWEASYESPLTFDYRDFTLCKAGPWSQGPVFHQQLALLAGFDLDGLSELDPEFVHLSVECAKLAFADREAFYGDPDFVDVPITELLGDDYNARRRSLVGETASMEIRPGDLPGYSGKVMVRLAEDLESGPVQFGVGEPTVASFDDSARDGTRGDTCHFDIIDRDGNMVSGTPSGGWLQSSPVIPGLGFCLSNRAQMFWLDPRSPACIAPRKRPRTTLTPNLALRNGEPYMVFGTPGGDQQDQWSLHFFLRHVHFGLNLQEAIDAPSFHTAHFPSSFYPRLSDPGHLALEGRFPGASRDELRRRGHRIDVPGDWCIGRLTAASREGGVLKAAANPRMMQGYAAGR